jgi:hypothetical protein
MHFLPDLQGTNSGTPDSISRRVVRDSFNLVAAARFHRLENLLADIVRSSSTSSLKKFSIVIESISCPSLYPAVTHHANFSARRSICVGRTSTLGPHWGKPTRRTRSWKRESECRLSKTGSTLRLISKSSRSSKPFSSHSKTHCLSPTRAQTAATIPGDA